MKPINFVRVNGIEVQFNKNWAICDIPGHSQLLSKLRGRQLFNLAPNEQNELVRTFTDVTEEIYEEDNDQ